MPAASAARPISAIERVDLAHEVALADAADGRIAGHFADRGGAMGDERGRGAAARGRRRGFAARMAAADHDDIKAGHVVVKVFHVKQVPPYFPTHSRAKISSQHVFHADPSDDPVHARGSAT